MVVTEELHACIISANIGENYDKNKTYKTYRPVYMYMNGLYPSNTSRTLQMKNSIKFVKM